jgi:hypothetical protein
MRSLHLVLIRENSSFVLRDEKVEYVHFNDLGKFSDYIVEKYHEARVVINCNDFEQKDKKVLQSKLEPRMDKTRFTIAYNIFN